ncbi:MAG: transposase [Ignavibacteriales bacterium]|nr:transposase [Ignavibacteriales bacterium]
MGKLPGTITEENGFVKAEKRILLEKAFAQVVLTKICVREYGFTSFLSQYNTLVTQRLHQYFPAAFQSIIYMAFAIFVHNSSIRNMPFHTAKSMLSVNDKTTYTEKYFSLLLLDIEGWREQATTYMQSFIKPNDFVLVDMTNIFSSSENIRYAKEGYNSDMVFERQFNLMYIYSPLLVQPVFYRLYSGNIREVKGFKLCLQESGIAEAVIIADKGFYSKANIENMKAEGLHFISPMKRNNKLIQYEKLQRKDLSYFKFENRYIWYIIHPDDGGRRVFLFKEEQLMVQEEKDYLDRITTLPEYYQIKTFHEKNERFGTIALLSNLETEDAKHIYTTYKSTSNVEIMVDGIKNILHAYRTYMQNEDALQGWMFINHIALHGIISFITS